MSQYNLQKIELVTGETVWEINETVVVKETGQIFKSVINRFKCFDADPDHDGYEQAKKTFDSYMAARADDKVREIAQKDVKEASFYK